MKLLGDKLKSIVAILKAKDYKLTIIETKASEKEERELAIDKYISEKEKQFKNKILQQQEWDRITEEEFIYNSYHKNIDKVINKYKTSDGKAVYVSLYNNVASISSRYIHPLNTEEKLRITERESNSETNPFQPYTLKNKQIAVISSKYDRIIFDIQKLKALSIFRILAVSFKLLFCRH